MNPAKIAGSLLANRQSDPLFQVLAARGHPSHVAFLPRSLLAARSQRVPEAYRMAVVAFEPTCAEAAVTTDLGTLSNTRQG